MILKKIVFKLTTIEKKQIEDAYTASDQLGDDVIQGLEEEAIKRLPMGYSPEEYEFEYPDKEHMEVIFE